MLQYAPQQSGSAEEKRLRKLPPRDESAGSELRWCVLLNFLLHPVALLLNQ
ncbi:MAG: hypothetical protein R3E93_09355 [Thiothrix sp.]